MLAYICIEINNGNERTEFSSVSSATSFVGQTRKVMDNLLS